EPVSTTGTPASRFAIVTVRTGRISGAVSTLSCRQAVPIATRQPASAQAAHGSRLDSLRDEERTSTATLSLPFRSSSIVLSRGVERAEKTPKRNAGQIPAPPAPPTAAPSRRAPPG